MTPPLSSAGVVLLSVAIVGLIAVLDHVTGLEVRVYPLYFVPIALAAWRGPSRFTLAVPLLSTAAWVGSNAFSDPTRWSPPVWAINSATQATAFLTIGVLISQLRIRLERERALSRRDPLTGLANTRAFHELGTALVAAAARAGKPVTLAYLDLDNFKQVNDTRGHLEGDRVLRTVAEALHARVRASDVAARLGGDEFALLLPNSDREGSARMLEQLRVAIVERMVAEGWPVTISIGAIAYAQAPPTMQEAVQRADGLMYVAKRGGKNRVHIEVQAPR